VFSATYTPPQKTIEFIFSLRRKNSARLFRQSQIQGNGLRRSLEFVSLAFLELFVTLLAAAGTLV